MTDEAQLKAFHVSMFVGEDTRPLEFQAVESIVKAYDDAGAVMRLLDVVRQQRGVQALIATNAVVSPLPEQFMHLAI